MGVRREKGSEGRKKERKEERKKGRKEERKKGRKEERKILEVCTAIKFRDKVQVLQKMEVLCEEKAFQSA